MREQNSKEPSEQSETWPAAYLLVGDGLRDVTVDQLAQKLGELGLERNLQILPIGNVGALRELVDIQDEVECTEPVPVPVTVQTFIGFAAQHGYSRARAFRSWNCIQFTKFDRRPSGLPRIRFMRDPDTQEDAVDLNSVHDRLVESNFHVDAWVRGSSDHVRFLTCIVDEILKSR